MTEAEVTPATLDEYRKMLEEIGLFTRVVDGGIDAVWWLGMRSFRLAFRRAENGWWEIHSLNAFETLDVMLWCSAYASDDTREFINNWVRVHPRAKR
jgi:hypothetical protein